MNTGLTGRSVLVTGGTRGIGRAVALIGHDHPRFTLRVYTYATKRRQRLTGTHREAFDGALEWAQMGTNADYTTLAVLSQVNTEKRNAA